MKLQWLNKTTQTVFTVINQEHACIMNYIFTCLVFVLLTDLLKVALAGKLRPKLTPKNLHFINILSGIILVGFGVALIWGILQFGHQLK